MYLRKLLAESCSDTATEAVRAVARNRLAVLDRAKTIHGQKAKALAGAIGFEAAAVAALTWAMIALLY